MPLVTSTEMFKKAYEGGYAIGAFNVNNMEIIQGIVEAGKLERSPLILQVSAGAKISQPDISSQARRSCRRRLRSSYLLTSRSRR